MFVIGIDPGMAGGIAMIPMYSFKDTKVWDMEKYSIPQINGIFDEIRHGSKDKADQAYWKDTQVVVFLEEPQLPHVNTQADSDKGPRHFNAQAHNKLGRALGVMEGLCVAHNWIPNLLSPRKWQYALNCQTGGNKKITLELAKKVFPFLHERFGYRTMVTDNTADALLIALFGYLLYAEEKYLPRTVSENISVEQRTKIGKMRLSMHERYAAKPIPNYRTVTAISRPQLPTKRGTNHARTIPNSERDGLESNEPTGVDSSAGLGSTERSRVGPSKHRPSK